MQTKKSQKMFSVVLIFAHEMTRTVQVRATTREIAERRAMKRNPGAVGIKHNA